MICANGVPLLQFTLAMAGAFLLGWGLRGVRAERRAEGVRDDD